jgi:hypothetical protein
VKKRDYNVLREYVRDMADALELRDWTITVTVTEPDSPGRADGKRWQASSESIPGRKFVYLTFAPDVREWRLQSLRSTVAHELIHAHFAPLIEMVREDLFQHLGRPTYEVFCDGATRWLEYGVDAMADATAKHLPLIEWPGAKHGD